jgi:hypothetical protein
MPVGKKVKKIFKKIDPFTAKVVDPMLGQSGLPNISGENANRDSAEREAALTRQQAEEQARLQQNMQANFAADLKGENLSNVVAGGTADAFSSGEPTKKRRAGGLTAALGV